MTSLINLSGDNQFGIGYGLLADIASSATIFALAYLLVHNLLDLTSYKMQRSVDLDFRNRIISFIHGLIAIFLSVRITVFYPQECGASTQPDEYNMLIITCGYMVYDMLAMWYLGLLNFDMAIHHFIVCLSFTQSLMTNFGAFSNCCAAFAAEVSNPPMHLRGMLRSLNKRYTKLYDTCQMTYFISFFFARIFVGQYFVYKTLICESDPIVTKMCALAIIFQSY